MTLTHTQERVPAAERIAVRCVDSDVHPVPKRGELTQYIPEPWRTKFFLDHKVGELIYYDAPDYAHSFAMRTDTFPPDGEFPGSDPDMAFRQLIMEAGSDIAILEPGGRTPRPAEAHQAYSSALNDWEAHKSLVRPNTAGRRRGGSLFAAGRGTE